MEEQTKGRQQMNAEEALMPAEEPCASALACSLASAAAKENSKE